MRSSPIRAPEISEGLEWFNTKHPLKLSEQHGKVVLLDFWTYCCINCMHILPDLRYLQGKYSDSLVIVGLHSPKFPNERIGGHVQKAINRYEITHPVANDPELIMWRQYAIHAWPSLVVIDTEGYIAATLSGEGKRDELDIIIGQLLAQAENGERYSRSIVKIKLKQEPANKLLFPGKLLASHERLYISDSGHHRVLELDHDGVILRSFGSGNAGFFDGLSEHARFYNPQGLVLAGHKLYVADTGNHALRWINLSSGLVGTLAGTGQQGGLRGDVYGDPALAALNSPWDLAYDNGILYIAMAGSHQIWSMDLTLNILGVFAGSGREALADGEAHCAAFAQPSGLSAGNGVLYVADSEISAVRAVDLCHGIVQTLVGKGLFDFGDQDGDRQVSLLQHPLDIAYDETQDTVWIADTYNSKIKKLEINANVISSVRVSQNLNEPAGISLLENSLWIANTNAHQILRFDIHSMKSEVLVISDKECRPEVSWLAMD